MKNSDKYITATDVRSKLFTLIEQVKKYPVPINITVKGIPEAVLISKEEYDSLEATLDVLSDRELVSGIKEGLADLKAGRVTSWSEVKKGLKLEDSTSSGYLVAEKKARYVPNRPVKPRHKRFKKT